jgi:hypothetical protein
MVATTMDLAREKGRYFYVWMAGACALVAVGGFAPTYWLQLAPGTFVGPPLLHIHGALFTAWTLLLLSQTWLASQGRLDHHRAWGLAGIALASAMVVVGVTTAIYSMNVELAAGKAGARAFLVVPLAAIGLFAGFFIAAIANIQRPEAHKRLILLATISLLQAAMGRVAFLVVSGGAAPGARPGLAPLPPLAVTIGPSLALELFIVAGAVYDWRTRGRPHPVWIIGAVVMTAAVLLRAPLAATPGWIAFAESLGHIAG